MSQKIVAIDGPSGSGKSTVARLVANRLGYVYIDTGSMFRSLGLYFDSLNQNLDDPNLIKNALDSGTFNFEYGKPESLVMINGVDYSKKIREHHVSKLASIISKNTQVREFLVSFQRSLVKQNYCVMEGRDIGTVVFPDAFCKIFVTASSEVRAKRRTEELKNRGEEVDFNQILKDIEKRDKEDMNREIAPLKQAEDAILLDTSSMSMEEVITNIIEIINKKRG